MHYCFIWSNVTISYKQHFSVLKVIMLFYELVCLLYETSIKLDQHEHTDHILTSHVELYNIDLFMYICSPV